jgi:Asp-tRNA(Asn)/Glu-tRNA(Gln) amidotransferase A subunit family amidase
MMLVAPMWSEARLLTVAHALEQAGIYDTRPVAAAGTRDD